MASQPLTQSVVVATGGLGTGGQAALPVAGLNVGMYELIWENAGTISAGQIAVDSGTSANPIVWTPGGVIPTILLTGGSGRVQFYVKPDNTNIANVRLNVVAAVTGAGGSITVTLNAYPDTPVAVGSQLNRTVLTGATDNIAPGYYRVDTAGIDGLVPVPSTVPTSGLDGAVFDIISSTTNVHTLTFGSAIILDGTGAATTVASAPAHAGNHLRLEAGNGKWYVTINVGPWTFA